MYSEKNSPTVLTDLEQSHVVCKIQESHVVSDKVPSQVVPDLDLYHVGSYI